MKLSAAIRIGSMTTKQMKGMLISGNHTCVLGSAISALGKSDIPLVKGDFYGYEFLRGAFPFLQFTINNRNYDDIMTQLWRWNDQDNYTREEIADRVEQMEWAEEYFEKHGRESKTEINQEVLI